MELFDGLYIGGWAMISIINGSDALIAKRARHDVRLRAPEPGRGDRQPGLRDGLTTPTRSGHQGMRN